ncbi:Fur family transcriptional regulator [Gammaproteobacteria bacterium]|nr:Fur family transcriptional regulator [Gammaproteobacteria bacterium]
MSDSQRPNDAEALEKTLRADGMRLTRQRQAILSVLADTTDHPSAEDILSRAREHDSSVSLATVYRTLSALEQRGAILRNDFDGNGARYELADTPRHGHLIDLDSGDLLEFESTKIDELIDEISKQLRVDITHHKIELYGRKRS